MSITTEIKTEIWQLSKPAGNFPKDYLVLPALDITRFIEKTRLIDKVYNQGRQDVLKEVDNLIKNKLTKLDQEAFKHCFKRGKMCDECYKKKEPLLEIQKEIKQIEEKE